MSKDNENRRLQGDFPTPPRFATLAHRYAVDAWGTDPHDRPWWDPCCGGGNLTADRPPYARTFASTLLPTDVDAVRASQPHVIAVQHDFLNGTDEGLPPGLREHLSVSDPITLILNPPFAAGTGGQSVAGQEGERSGVSDTRIGELMRGERMGKACQSTTAQFLRRIVEIVDDHALHDVRVILFSQATFICGSGYDSFRDLWFSRFRPVGGFCFDAREFEGIKQGWPVVCSLWERGSGSREVTVDVRGGGSQTFTAVPSGSRLSDWVERPKMTVVRPPMTNALEVAAPNQRTMDRMAEGGIGHLYFHANDVRHTENGCYLTSGPNPGGKGWSVTPDNFERSMICLTARRLVTETWLNSQEQFRVPEVEGEGWDEWVADAVVWATLNRRNYATSLPSLEYRGEIYEVRNHFFWQRAWGKETVCSAWLRDHHARLSPQGIAVLHLGYTLFELAAPWRERADPRFHLERPDAGFQQLRRGVFDGPEAVGDETCRAVWGVFLHAYEALTDRLRPGVRRFGFLK